MLRRAAAGPARRRRRICTLCVVLAGVAMRRQTGSMPRAPRLTWARSRVGVAARHREAPSRSPLAPEPWRITPDWPLDDLRTAGWKVSPVAPFDGGGKHVAALRRDSTGGSGLASVLRGARRRRGALLERARSGGRVAALRRPDSVSLLADLVSPRAVGVSTTTRWQAGCARRGRRRRARRRTAGASQGLVRSAVRVLASREKRTTVRSRRRIDGSPSASTTEPRPPFALIVAATAALLGLGFSSSPRPTARRSRPEPAARSRERPPPSEQDSTTLQNRRICHWKP